MIIGKIIQKGGLCFQIVTSYVKIYYNEHFIKEFGCLIKTFAFWLSLIGYRCSFAFWLSLIGYRCSFAFWISLIGYRCSFAFWLNLIGYRCSFAFWLNLIDYQSYFAMWLNLIGYRCSFAFSLNLMGYRCTFALLMVSLTTYARVSLIFKWVGCLTMYQGNDKHNTIVIEWFNYLVSSVNIYY